MSRIGLANSTDQYRRHARRIRGRFAGQPQRLYRSLRQLSDRHDARVANAIPRQSIPQPSRHVDAFAQFAAGRMEQGILRYSERLQLLDVAQQLGIQRFDANLIIAAVQHRLGTQLRNSDGIKSHITWPIIFAALVVVQSGIGLIAWALFIR